MKKKTKTKQTLTKEFRRKENEQQPATTAKGLSPFSVTFEPHID